jgi:CRISPR-associated protein Cas1
MHTLLNTLYLTSEHTWVRLENETLRIEIAHELRQRVPLHHLQSVVCMGDVLVTPAAMAALAAQGKSLVYLDRNGRFKARLEGPVAGNVLLRVAQHRLAQQPQAQLPIARNMVAGKLQNARQVLLRSARETQDPADKQQLAQAADKLAHTIKQLPMAQDADTLRGLEGDAARVYFAAFALHIVPAQRQHFPFQNRNRRPPLDPTNALLSFLYSLLMNDCRSALEATGLDPQVGCFHALRPGRAALALDLMEEFRPILADRLAITLINRKQLGPKDFESQPGGAVLLSDQARRLLLVSY